MEEENVSQHIFPQYRVLSEKFRHYDKMKAFVSLSV